MKHSFNKDRKPGENPRRVFTVSDRELKLGYIQVEVQLYEYGPKGEQRINLVTGGGGDSVDLGKKKSAKLYFRDMEPGLAGTGKLEFKARGCVRNCAEVHVTYRYGRLN